MTHLTVITITTFPFYIFFRTNLQVSVLTFISCKLTILKSLLSLFLPPNYYYLNKHLNFFIPLEYMIFDCNINMLQ